MRFWSIHPKYLDSKGLVACWREALLAKKVLMGKTKGYKEHPQLKRFKEYEKPLDAINSFLYHVFLEAKTREYNFDAKKIKKNNLLKAILVNNEQLNYEFKHLLEKTRKRSPGKYEELKKVKIVKVHPLFKEIKGPVEDWEKT